MKKIQFSWLVGVSVLAAMLLSSCNAVAGHAVPMDDLRYLTPIPEATLAAFSPDQPITSRVEAVIAARRLLETTRLSFSTSPGVIYVDQITLGEALQRENVPTQEYQYYHPTGTMIWLVAFEGEGQVIPPQAGTPGPEQTSVLRCTYVIIESGQTDSVRSIPENCPEN
jgi:hypothetical protein